MTESATLDKIEPITEAPVAHGLSVVSIAKSYDKRAVLTDVSVSVGKGEVIGLLGPNGAGKTTCFYSVMGLVKPDSGRIMLDGDDITGLPMYRRAILGLGYLPQETSIFRGLTVEKNILTVLELAHGCVSCTLREDLLPLLRRLARRPEVTRIVVRLDEAMEPEPVSWAIRFK